MGDGVLFSRLLPRLGGQRTDCGGNVLPNLCGSVEKGEDVVKRFVLEHDHVLPQGLSKCEEAALRIVPCVNPELPLVRFKGLRDSRDALTPPPPRSPRSSRRPRKDSRAQSL